MELHCGKFQLISTVCPPPSLVTPHGTIVNTKPSMDYLGAVVHSSGCADHEVSRRIAMAKADFYALDKTWTHSALTWKQKLRIYVSLVETKLLYSLASLVLTVAQQRKVNGFQNRCLRRIVGIKPAYISRVSNVCVLSKASHTLATKLLNKRRLQLFGRILRCPEGHALKLAAFIPNTDTPATERYVRRVGRPSKEWVKEAIDDTALLFGSLDAAKPLAMQKVTWNSALFEKLGY